MMYTDDLKGSIWCVTHHLGTDMIFVARESVYGGRSFFVSLESSYLEKRPDGVHH